MNHEASFHAAASAVTSAESSQMFGKPCYKIKGKAFVCFFKNTMVFKLNGDMHKRALSLDGSELFDPSGTGRAMKEWIVVHGHTELWAEFAQAAAKYIST